MKLQLHSARVRQGNTLLMTLLTAALVGTALVSAVSLTEVQNRATNRSQNWNSAIPVLEAGIEESLTQLNLYGTNMNGGYVALGWYSYTSSGVIYNYKWRGTPNGWAYMTVSNATSSRPGILCYGYVPRPNASPTYTYNPGGYKWYDYSDTIIRRVHVTTQKDALFSRGMVAKGTIDMSGNNVATDSFDSADPAFSGPGGTYDKTKNKDNGDVATNSGVVNSLAAGNADIEGHASTGPGGSVSIGSNGSIGNEAWVEGGHTGIQPGFVSDDMNVQFPDVLPPFTSGGFNAEGPSTANVLIGMDTYRYAITNSGNYYLPSLNMSGQESMLIKGDVVLYLRDPALASKLSGQAQIVVAPGSSLKLYVANGNMDLGGNGVVNQAGNAINFSYYGLPSNTSLSFSGNNSFTGVIYAPQAAFTLGGGGSDTYDFVGSSITGTVKMNGHFNFHYDENLARVGPTRGYIITSWNEF